MPTANLNSNTRPTTNHKSISIPNSCQDNVSSISSIGDKESTPIWYVKDNNHTNNIPPFLSTLNYNLSEPIRGETLLYFFFFNMFTDEMFELIVKETIRYTIQSEDHS